MNITATCPAPAGREQPCLQCGATFRARRPSARFCGNTCRQRAHYRSRPKARARLDMLRRWLLRRGFAGQIGPATALTLPRSLVLPELHKSIRALRAASPDLTTLDPMTEAEFVAALNALAILDYGKAAKAGQVQK